MDSSMRFLENGTDSVPADSNGNPLYMLISLATLVFVIVIVCCILHGPKACLKLCCPTQIENMQEAQRARLVAMERVTGRANAAMNDIYLIPDAIEAAEQGGDRYRGRRIRHDINLEPEANTSDITESTVSVEAMPLSEEEFRRTNISREQQQGDIVVSVVDMSV